MLLLLSGLAGLILFGIVSALRSFEAELDSVDMEASLARRELFRRWLEDHPNARPAELVAQWTETRSKG